MNPIWIDFHRNFGEILENNINQRIIYLRYRNIRDFQNPLEIPDDTFIKLFRLNKHLVMLLIGEIANFDNDVRVRRDKIPLHLEVLVSLNFFGHGNFQTTVGRDLNLALSQPSISRIINKISTIFTVNLLPRYVKFPTTEEDIQRVKQGFLIDLNFPNTVGAIDGSHISIFTPKIEDPIMPAIAYLNRKGYYSINMQAICDSNMAFLNANCRFPGATHDAAIWELSSIKSHLKRRYQAGRRNTWLIGDSGYPVQPWLLTPINDAAPNTPESLYTNRHKSARNVIERSFGCLKQRFKCLLKSRVLYYTHRVAAQITYSCVVLHNICRMYNLPQIEEDIETDDEDMEEEHDVIGAPDLNILTEGRLVRRQAVDLIANM